MTILKVVLVAVGVISCLLLFGGPDITGEPKEVEAFRDGGAMGFASMFTGFIVFLGVGLILLFFVVQLISNPKRTIRFAGTSDTSETLQLRQPSDNGTIAATTAGLWTVIVAVVVGVLAIIAGFFTRAIK